MPDKVISAFNLLVGTVQLGASMITAQVSHLSPELQATAHDYAENGFSVVRGLFSPTTAVAMREHFMTRRAEGPKPGDMGGDTANPNDPLNRYPRMINMHDWDKPSATWSSSERLLAAVAACIGQKAVLCQTMLYFKPPGARGQAFHQDQQYITKDPLIGAWCALDTCDADNGQMVVIPGSHRLGLLPVVKADLSISFTEGQAEIPQEYREYGVDMNPGDVLLFSGKTIHGSHPNQTKDRFRRGFISHFIGVNSSSFVPEKGYNMAHLAP
jgi:phytanoyl-CoA hydroxylase